MKLTLTAASVGSERVKSFVHLLIKLKELTPDSGRALFECFHDRMLISVREPSFFDCRFVVIATFKADFFTDYHYDSDAMFALSTNTLSTCLTNLTVISELSMRVRGDTCELGTRVETGLLRRSWVPLMLLQEDPEVLTIRSVGSLHDDFAAELTMTSHFAYRLGQAITPITRVSVSSESSNLIHFAPDVSQINSKELAKQSLSVIDVKPIEHPFELCYSISGRVSYWLAGHELGPALSLPRQIGLDECVFRFGAGTTCVCFGLGDSDPFTLVSAIQEGDLVPSQTYHAHPAPAGVTEPISQAARTRTPATPNAMI